MKLDQVIGLPEKEQASMMKQAYKSMRGKSTTKFLQHFIKNMKVAYKPTHL